MRRVLLLLVVLSAVSLPAARASMHQWSIVGGSTAAPTAYPFMAALVSSAASSDRAGQFCGGTVIAPLVVLTAAHCTVTGVGDAPVAPSAITVVLGKSDLATPAEGGERHAVARIARHPTFDVVIDDIALLHLTSPTAVTPVGLPAANESGPGVATAIGWGATATAAAPTGTTFPTQLQEVALPVQPDSECDYPDYQAPQMLCAGSVALPLRNICFGDSGGPLLVPTGGVPHQVGIASWVVGLPDSECSAPPAVFTRVETYLDFIEAQLTPAVSAVTVVARPGGVLRVSWTLAAGGAPPALTVTTTAGSQVHAVPTGAAFVDIPGLPLRTALKATVTAVNAYGSGTATSAGSATVVAPPSFVSVGLKNGTAIDVTLSTNGGITSVEASWGPNAASVTTAGAVSLADTGALRSVVLPMTGLVPGQRYIARATAANVAGTTTSIWIEFTAATQAPALVSRPVVGGVRRSGRRLTCRPGVWTATPDPTFTYVWRIGARVIGRSRTLRVPAAARGRRVVCVTTARNVAGKATAKSPSVLISRR